MRTAELSEMVRRRQIAEMEMLVEVEMLLVLDNSIRDGGELQPSRRPYRPWL